MEHQNASAMGATATHSDIAQFEATDIAVLDVLDKKGDGPLLYNGQPVQIEIRSPGTREALGAKHKVDQAAQVRMFAGMRGKQVKESVDDKINERAEKLAAITAGIRNFPIGAGDLYRNPKLGYITDQVEAFHIDWANF